MNTSIGNCARASFSETLVQWGCNENVSLVPKWKKKCSNGVFVSLSVLCLSMAGVISIGNVILHCTILLRSYVRMNALAPPIQQFVFNIARRRRKKEAKKACRCDTMECFSSVNRETCYIRNEKNKSHTEPDTETHSRYPHTSTPGLGFSNPFKKKTTQKEIPSRTHDAQWTVGCRPCTDVGYAVHKLMFEWSMNGAMTCMGDGDWQHPWQQNSDLCREQ